MTITDEVGRSFEEEWPELARRLERFLAAKGVETWLRADVVQETATRVYRKWPRLDKSRPLWNLVVTIALGILVDERRRTSRLELVSDVQQPDIDDVETRALHRVHLVKARAALTRLRADQRRVLLAEIGEATAPDGSRNRVNVLRLRARLALKGELGPWAPVGIGLRLRSLRAAIERRLAEWGRDGAGVTASIAGVTVAAALLVPMSEAGAGTDRASLRAQTSYSHQILAPDGTRRDRSQPLLTDISGPGPRKVDSPGSDTKERAEREAQRVTKPVTDELNEARETYHEVVRNAHDARDDTRKSALETYHEAVRDTHDIRDDTRESVLDRKQLTRETRNG